MTNSAEILFYSVNTGMNLSTTTGSEQFVKERREKKLKNVFIFLCAKLEPRSSVGYPSPCTFKRSPYET